eukprot:4729015-Lingulodinium_polyedra.AAC.1
MPRRASLQPRQPAPRGPQSLGPWRRTSHPRHGRTGKRNQPTATSRTCNARGAAHLPWRHAYA